MGEVRGRGAAWRRGCWRTVVGEGGGGLGGEGGHLEEGLLEEGAWRTGGVPGGPCWGMGRDGGGCGRGTSLAQLAQPKRAPSTGHSQNPSKVLPFLLRLTEPRVKVCAEIGPLPACPV